MWIESHQTLRRHSKVRKAAILLDVSMPAVIGHLHCLWWWATDQHPDGDLTKEDALDIALGAEWTGDADHFVESLVRVNLLDRTDDGRLVIHDWTDYAGRLIETRKRNAERQRAWREKTKEAPVEAQKPPVTRRRRATPDVDSNTGEPPKAKESRACRIPSDFQITNDLRSWSSAKGMSEQFIEHETEKFIEYWRGSGKTKVDWPATWRGWMLRAQEQGGSPTTVAPARSRATGTRNGGLSLDELAAVARGERP